MKLPKPRAPFQKLKITGESIVLDTLGKVLVLPTGSDVLLPSFNEYVLNSNRLTIAESPFGGLKGSGSPDYAPGTLFCQTDGVYLTDTSGTNSTKTLTAGKLKELSLLTVDTDAHTVTEEFIVENTATSNNPTVIMPVSATGWDFSLGSGTITVENGRLKVVGTCNTTGSLRIRKTGLSINIASYEFIRFQIESSVSSKLSCVVYTNAGYTDYTSWIGDRFPFFSNTTFALPVKAPVGSAGQNPDIIVGTQNWGAVTNMQFGVYGLGNGENVTFYVGDITADTAKTAYIELQTPDNLADSSLTLQAWNGSAYQTTGVYKLDSSYSAVSTTTANWKLSDGTKFDDCYGSGNGRALFPKGISAETKAGSTGNITYSANKGTVKRIGFRVDLPPADGGRTNFNKCRIKAILSYTDTVGNVVPDLSGNNNTGTIVGGGTKLNSGGLQFDGISGYIDSGVIQNLNFTTEDFSIYLDVYLGSVAGDDVLLSRGRWNEDGFTTHVLSTGVIQFHSHQLNTNQVVASTATTLNERHKIIFTRNQSAVKIYIDGVDRTASGTISNPLTSTKKLYIGRDWINNSYDLLGIVYSAKIYNKTLSENEIVALSQNNHITDSLLLYYLPTIQNMGSTTHDFADSTNTSYGLQNLSKPWIALYSPTDSLIDFYLFTHRPKQLEYKRDENGTIYELTLYPGNGQIYHGQITYADLTRLSQKQWPVTPGTLYTPSTNISLTDTAGGNAGQTLTAATLQGLSALTIDTDNHTITEAFQIKNTALNNNETVLDACETASNWQMEVGTGEISVENGKIKAVGNADGSGKFRIYTTLINDLSAYKFLKFQINSSVTAQVSAIIWSTSGRKVWTGTRFPLTENTDTIFVLPTLAPVGTTGAYPSTVVNPFDVATVSSIVIGVQGLTASQAVTLYIDSLSGDVEKTATLEINTPDELSTPNTLTLQCWTGAGYETVRIDTLDGEYANVSTDSTKLKYLDTVLLDDALGSGNGIAIFPKGSANSTVTGSVGTLTYSNVLPLQKKIGVNVSLPPSDGGRTDVNIIRLKMILDYVQQTTLPAVLNKFDDGSVAKFLENYGMVI